MKQKTVTIELSIAATKTEGDRRRKSLENIATETVGVKRKRGNVSGLIQAIADLTPDEQAVLIAFLKLTKKGVDT